MYFYRGPIYFTYYSLLSYKTKFIRSTKKVCQHQKSGQVIATVIFRWWWRSEAHLVWGFCTFSKHVFQIINRIYMLFFLTVHFPHLLHFPSDRIQVWNMRLRISAGHPVLRHSWTVTERWASPSDVPHKLRPFSTPDLYTIWPCFSSSISLLYFLTSTVFFIFLDYFQFLVPLLIQLGLNLPSLHLLCLA